MKHSNKWQNVNKNEIESQIANEFKKIEITKPLMEKIVERAKEVLSATHSWVDKEKKALQNKLNTLELRRDNLETDRLDRVIDQDTYQRQHKIIRNDISLLQNQVSELSENRDNNIDIFWTFMALTDNLYDTYIKADNELKKQLIWLFFESITVKDKKIEHVKHTLIVEQLLKNKKLIITKIWLTTRV